MKLAHIAIVTPHRAGLYETVRDLVAAERAAGVDAVIVDPNTQNEDRGVPIAGAFNPSEYDEPFSGDRCQFLTANRECSSETKSVCRNGGVCR
jgi:hypothetical protein